MILTTAEVAVQAAGVTVADRVAVVAPPQPAACVPVTVWLVPTCVLPE